MCRLSHIISIIKKDEKYIQEGAGPNPHKRNKRKRKKANYSGP